MFILKAIVESVKILLVSFFITLLTFFSFSIVFSTMWGGYPGCHGIQNTFGCTLGIPDGLLTPVISGTFGFFSILFYIFKIPDNSKRYFVYGMLGISLLCSVLLLINSIRNGTSMLSGF